VHVRLTDQGAVVLDLRRDEYLTLNLDQAAALSGLVQGWPAPALAKSADITDDRITGFVTSLLGRGVVTTDIRRGKSASEADIVPARTSLVQRELPAVTFRCGDFATFLFACGRAAMDLHVSSLDRAVARVERRKRSRLATPGSTSGRALEELVSSFLFMSPFVYTQREKCLYESLALVHFLAAYDFFPNLVIGIRDRPFEAHAWVQESDCVLNYNTEFVRAFAPIMVV
jgi:hypothetical protein